MNCNKINKTNRFFKALFSENVVTSTFTKCCICGEMVFTVSNRKEHEFVRHYGKGIQSANGEKPLNYVNMGDIEIYEIKFSEHKNDYDFFNSEELVEEFLTIVRERFRDRSIGKRVVVESGFSIENVQHVEGFSPISDVRYWSTKPIQSKKFNEFVYFSLKKIF